MVKAVSLLFAGSIVGALAMYLVLVTDDSATQDQSSRSLLAAVADAALGRRQPPDAISIAERLAVYRSAADESDLAAIQRELETTAFQTGSAARDVRIDALIARLSELAPAQAAALTRELGLEANFIAAAYVNWAEVDPAAALSGLAAVENQVTKRELSLALLDVFGNDAVGFDRLSAGMAQSERDALMVEWLGRRADFDPVGAFREAQELFDTDLQRRALLRIGTAWAEQDPVSALLQADRLPDSLQAIYRSNVFNEWARLDGAAFLAWLESVDSPPNEAMSGMRWLAVSNAERLIGIVDRKTGNQWRTARRTMMSALAEVDPDEAIERAAAWPPGGERDSLLMAIGAAVARAAPDEALAWARNLSPPSPIVMRQIAMSIAQSDLSQALNFIDNPPEGIDPQLITAIVVSAASQDPGQAEVLANQLIARDSIQIRNALRNLIGNWMQQDPEHALDWILVHDDQVNAGVLGTAGRTMAGSDPVAAAAYVDRIPAEYRSAWITQVAAPYALYDPAAASMWLAQFRGQSFYDDALRGVIAGSAENDPRRAAELFSQASGEVQLGTARVVARLWAQKEPRAATRWASDLADERTRNSAIGPAVSAWANGDPVAAESWTLDLERGETRDQALHALTSQASASGDFDRSLLSAYSSDPARQDALQQVIPRLAQTKPDEADNLLELVTNATTRRQLEQQIAEINALR